MRQNVWQIITAYTVCTIAFSLQVALVFLHWQQLAGLCFWVDLVIYRVTGNVMKVIWQAAFIVDVIVFGLSSTSLVTSSITASSLPLKFDFFNPCYIHVLI